MSIQAQPFIRGLQLRCDYALALVRDQIYGTDTAPDIAENASLQGFQDYEANRTDSPLMFRDVPMLSGWWKHSYDSIEENTEALKEMSTCPGCQDEGGDPCRIHW